MVLRRAIALKVSGVVFGAMILVGLGLLALFHVTVERRWQTMEQRCLELRAELLGGPAPRRALRGRPTPGDSREDYKAAIKAAEAFSFPDYRADSMPLIPMGTRDLQPEAEFQQSLEPVIAPLKRGAARETFQRAMGLDLRPGEEEIDYPYDVVRIAACRARYLAQQGRRREAAELLLDGCRFGTDLGEPHLLLPSLTALSDLLQDEALAGSDAAEIARELVLLEAELPRRCTEARWMLLLMGSEFIKSDGKDQTSLVSWGAPETPVEWYFGWSLRLLLADGFLGADRICRGVERRDDWGWTEACAAWTAPPRTPRTVRDNPIPDRFEFRYIPFDLHYREITAKVRVLQVASHHRATGEILALQDPFGSVIQTRKTGSRMRIWSAGPRVPVQIYRFQAIESHDLRFHPGKDDAGADPEIALDVPF